MSNTYITGTGQQLVDVHEQNDDCMTYGCVIHNPTDPHQDWPTHWREDRGIMERICPCGVGHPDKDQLSYIARRLSPEAAEVEGIHGCCGCCGS